MKKVKKVKKEPSAKNIVSEMIEDEEIEESELEEDNIIDDDNAEVMGDNDAEIIEDIPVCEHIISVLDFFLFFPKKF